MTIIRCKNKQCTWAGEPIDGISRNCTREITYIDDVTHRCMHYSATPHSGRKWIRCIDELPKNGVIVETKIDDIDGVRNHQNLQRIKGLWFLPSGEMYVYYTPTHWRTTK